MSEQEVMINITNMMMETYLSESLALRIQKLNSLRDNISVYRDILDVNLYDASHSIRKSAFDAISSFVQGDEAEQLLKAADILTRVNGVNVKDARRRIADKLIEDNCYKF